MTATAERIAQVSGMASAAGNEGINNDALGYIANNEDVGLSVNGIIMSPSRGLGAFSLQAANTKKSAITAAAEGTYGIFGCLQNYGTNPNIQMQLLTATIPANLLSKDTGTIKKGTAVATAISKGANTWDQEAYEDIFKGNDFAYTPGTGNAVALSSDRTITYSTRSNSKWTEGWTSKLSSNTIAVTIDWFRYNPLTRQYVTVKTYTAGPQPQIVESDCWYNSRLPWTIASAESGKATNIFDVQTIATHELGHTLGLDDLYDSSNSGEMMYGYNNGQVIIQINEMISVPKVPIKKIARRAVRISPTSTLQEVSRILLHNGVQEAIVDNSSPGLINLADITRAVAEGKTDVQVKELMTRGFLTIDSEEPIYEAIKMMGRTGAGQLVISENGVLWGIVSAGDLIKSLTPT